MDVIMIPSVSQTPPSSNSSSTSTFSVNAVFCAISAITFFVLETYFSPNAHSNNSKKYSGEELLAKARKAHREGREKSATELYLDAYFAFLKTGEQSRAKAAFEAHSKIGKISFGNID